MNYGEIARRVYTARAKVMQANGVGMALWRVAVNPLDFINVRKDPEYQSALMGSKQAYDNVLGIRVIVDSNLPVGSVQLRSVVAA